MKPAIIVLLIISGCVGINLYNDQQADQRRAQNLLQYNESLDRLNSSFNKDPAIFLESIQSNDHISHLHSRDELYDLRTSEVYSIDVQDHFAKDKPHLWGLDPNWIRRGLLDVQKDSNDSMFRYILYADYTEPYSTAFSLSCSKELIDYIRAFEALSYGSDYYLAKPIIFDELLAVIRNLLKKYEVQSNYWILDPSNVSLTDPNNKNFKLTNTEYNIFEIIIKNSDNFISRNEIYKVLGKEFASASDRSGDMLISRIRKKIEPVNKNQKIFNSIRGKGYKFTQLIKFNNN